MSEAQRADAAPISGRSPFRARVQELGAAVSKLLGRPAFWIVAIALAFMIPLGHALASHATVPLPPKLSIPLPEFRLTDQHGLPYGSKELRGRVWVADFVFTSCPTACPKLTKRMGEIQHRSRGLGDAFHLVTFTVDPENDTPERLAAYALQNRASATRWSFLTGASKDIETTVVKGFKIAMGKEATSPDGNIFSIFHGEKLVLVDAEGNIRGYYDADDAGIDAILRDAGLVANAALAKTE